MVGLNPFHLYNRSSELNIEHKDETQNQIRLNGKHILLNSLLIFLNLAKAAIICNLREIQLILKCNQIRKPGLILSFTIKHFNNKIRYMFAIKLININI